MKGATKSEKIYVNKTLFQLVLRELNLEAEFTSLGKLSFAFIYYVYSVL